MTLVTEKEAAEKWCPMARTVIGSVSDGMFLSTNAMSLNTTLDADTRKQTNLGKCIGSRCMAWRPVHQWRVRSDKPWQDGSPRGDGKGPNNETRTLGYCGAFGKAEQ